MPIATKHYDADTAAAQADVPNCFEDCASLVEVARPGVVGVYAPVACEGDGGDDEFPFDSCRFVAG